MTTAGGAGADRWPWIRPVLTAACVVLPVACTILSMFNSDESTVRLAVGAGAALAFGAWSVALDRRSRRDHDLHRATWPLIYLAGAFVLFVVMVLASPTYLFVAFVLYWQVFSLLELKLAIPGAVVLAGLMIWLQLRYNGRALTDDPTLVIGGVISILFGVVLAVWIGGIIQQSGERATLIDELEATQAELAEVSHEAGVLAERERLTHEIHDTLAQGFTSIDMLAQAAASEWDARPADARAHLEAIERTARDNLAEARNLVEGAAPAPLDRDSLPDALRRLADRLGSELGVTATAEIRGEARVLAPAVEVAILRAAQEALANIRKHAGPEHIALTLLYSEEGTVLEVSDDGQGFDVDAREDAPAGFGLRGMKSRLEQVGGAVAVHSAVGEGTTVTVTLP